MMDSMTIGEIISLVVVVVGYATALIAIYISIKIKLKELDLKILALESNLTEFKTSNEIEREKEKAKNVSDHAAIMVKLEVLLEKIYELKIENATNNGRKQNNISKNT